jgi:hypothetical protein
MPIIALILKAFSAPSVLAKLKAPISAILKLNSKLNTAQWLAALKAHLTAHPLSYLTVISTMYTFVPDVVRNLHLDATGDVKEQIAQVLTSLDFIPDEIKVGGDGDKDTVWGMSEAEFSKHVNSINNAKVVVEEASYILGISPMATIELATLLRAIEPQFKELYKGN